MRDVGTCANGPPAAPHRNAFGVLLSRATRCLIAVRSLFPPTMQDTALPERVCREIEVEQQKADILISVVQAVLCVAFATLYLAARKTIPADTSFNPVPWALAGYGVLTSVRLIAAFQMRLPPWFQQLSIFADMALLFGLIWSFHIEYRQVPAFYLKAPTLLYVFIFIALRALRFDASHVLFAGVSAAVGWLALVIYAVIGDPGRMPVTHDYVAYMTSAVILWGAEIDKIIAIVLVTLLIAAAIARARWMLFRAVTEGQAKRDLKMFFEPDIAARITSAEAALHPGEGEIRNATILFVDLRGFTALSRHIDANALIALLAEYQARLVPVIQRHGGSIDKFLGDGILASFGAVRPSDIHAADALRAVDELVTEAQAWREDRNARGLSVIPVGAAVASGPVLFGVVGDASRLEYTVIGEAVNIAARLEKQTKVYGVKVLAAADTYALALAQGYASPHPTPVHRWAEIEGVGRSVEVVVAAA